MTLEKVLDKYRNHPDFLGLQLKHANQPGAVDDTPLHIAARKGEAEDVAILVANGADVNQKGDIGNTPLHQAAMRGHVSVIKQLLSLGANPRVMNEFFCKHRCKLPRSVATKVR